MIIKEKYIVPAKEELKTTSVQCDICKYTVKNPNYVNLDGSIDWVRDFYQEKTTAIFSEEKCSFPEGGNLERTEFHICPNCFTDKVAPFLESLGATANIVEYDW